MSAAHGEGRTVLLDARRGRYWGLDEVGATIWSALEAGRTVEEIVTSLEAEFDAPRERLESDTRAFLAQLAASRLVEAS